MGLANFFLHFAKIRSIVEQDFLVIKTNILLIEVQKGIQLCTTLCPGNTQELLVAVKKRWVGGFVLAWLHVHRIA